MPGRRAVQPFEPVLVEKRGERRLPERRLPQNAEERGFRLIGFAFEERRHRSGFGGRPLARIRPGAEPEIDQPPPLRRGEYKMGDLVQDHISFGVGVERRAVPIKPSTRAEWMHRYTEMLAKGGPQALALTKQLLHRSSALTTAHDFAAMLELSAARFASAEGQEGIRAFAEKRPASWVPTN